MGGWGVSRFDRAIWELAHEQYGVVALRQLREVGLSDGAVRDRLADRRLHPLFRGVVVVGARYPSLRGRWKGATLALGDDALLSHHDAAVLANLSTLRQAAIHVTVPGRHAESRPGIRAHRTRGVHPADRAVVDGIPVTSVARTLLDLAAVLDATRLRRAYEQAERAGGLDLTAIVDVLERTRGHRGARRLRRLIGYDPAAAAAAESELERIFLDLLRTHGVPGPRVNVLVEGFLVDAYWPDAGLVVELDGYEFHNDREAFERDRRRIVELRAAGHEVLPLTYSQVAREPRWTVDAVVHALERRTLTPGS